MAVKVDRPEGVPQAEVPAPPSAETSAGAMVEQAQVACRAAEAALEDTLAMVATLRHQIRQGQALAAVEVVHQRVDRLAGVSVFTGLVPTVLEAPMEQIPVEKADLVVLTDEST